MRIYFAFSMLFVVILFVSCKRDFSNNDIAKIHLSAQSVEVSEAWLNLTIEDLDTNTNYTVKRDSYTVFSGKLENTDTLIHDTGLEPATNYQYIANNDKHAESLSILKITTMDTTSHDFSWRFYKFGWPVRGSGLYDVAIVKEDNSIWCVGEIHTEDTDCWNVDSTEWLPGYNAVHWNGVEWVLKRIYWNYDGNKSWSHISTILVFKENDMWFGGVYWNGNKFISMPMNIDFPFHIHKRWGIASSNLYIIGDTGSIAHYDGTAWAKKESGTEVTLVDIYGNHTGEKIWICGFGGVDPTVLLKIENNQITKLIESKEILGHYNPEGISGGIKSVWVDSQDNLYVLTWFDLYKCPKGDLSKAKSLWRYKYNQDWAFNRVRGNDLNDIVTVGTYGNIWHYNGKTWKYYDELSDPRDEFFSVDIYGDMIVAVGERYINGIERYGIVYVGRR